MSISYAKQVGREVRAFNENGQQFWMCPGKLVDFTSGSVIIDHGSGSGLRVHILTGSNNWKTVNY